MIIKSLTRKAGGSAPILKYIFRYIFQEEKVNAKSRKVQNPYFKDLGNPEMIKSLYARAMQQASVSFNRHDLRYLLAEKVDAQLLEATEHKPQHIPFHTFFLNYHFSKQYDLLRNSKDKEIEPTHPYVITHNVNANNIEGMIERFEEVNASRVYKRKDQVQVEHIILSWSNKEKELTEEMVMDMAREFIKLRGEENLFAGAIHRDKEHLHCHLAVSGTNLMGASSRISMKEFEILKDKLQEYQKQKYPALTESLPLHGRAKMELSNSPPNPYIKNRTMLDKDMIQQCLDRHYPNSHSIKEFLDKVREDGFEIYERNGFPQGVIVNNLKHRFGKFDYTKEKWEQLNQIEKQETKLMEIFENLREKEHRELEIMERDNDFELEIADAFGDSLDENDDDDDDINEQNDIDEVDEIEDSNFEEDDI